MHPALDNIPGVQWFHHGERVLQLLQMHRPMTIVEIGTYQAGSAIAMARVALAWGGHVTTLEAFPATVPEPTARKNVEACGMSDVVTLIDHPSVEIARFWPSYWAIDFLYIDGDHTDESVTLDLANWYPLLRPGALYLGDDYDNPMFPGVTTAWDRWEQQGHPLVREEPNPRSVPPGMRLVYGVKE